MSGAVERILRYGCVGIATSLLYSILVIVCIHVFQTISPTIVSLLAFIFAIPFSYAAHRLVTFEDRPHDAFQPLRFVVSTAMSFLVAVGGMYWITEVAGKSYLFGVMWNWLVIPVMNFILYMYWVFRGAQDERRAA